MSLTQLNPPLPIETPRGSGLAHAIIDYGPEGYTYFLVFLDKSREIWQYSNRECRAQENITMGRLPEGNVHSNDDLLAVATRIRQEVADGKVPPIEPLTEREKAIALGEYVDGDDPVEQEMEAELADQEARPGHIDDVGPELRKEVFINWKEFFANYKGRREVRNFDGEEAQIQVTEIAPGSVMLDESPDTKTADTAVEDQPW